MAIFHSYVKGSSVHHLQSGDLPAPMQIVPPAVIALSVRPLNIVKQPIYKYKSIYTYVYIYIYIHMYMERERERERDMYIIYIYIYT